MFFYHFLGVGFNSVLEKIVLEWANKTFQNNHYLKTTASLSI